MAIKCLPENITKISLGIFFILMGLGAVVIGLTILPIIGLVLSLPFFYLAYYFIRAHLNRECEISNKVS